MECLLERPGSISPRDARLLSGPSCGGLDGLSGEWRPFFRGFPYTNACYSALCGGSNTVVYVKSWCSIALISTLPNGGARACDAWAAVLRSLQTPRIARLSTLSVAVELRFRACAGDIGSRAPIRVLRIVTV